MNERMHTHTIPTAVKMKGRIIITPLELAIFLVLFGDKAQHQVVYPQEVMAYHSLLVVASQEHIYP